MTKPELNLAATADDPLAPMGAAARAAFSVVSEASPETRTAGLKAMAAAIRARASEILAANAEDVAASREAGLTEAKIDRLTLDETRLEGVAAAVDAIADQPDPVGAELARWKRPNGLDIARVRTPIGVIAMIYESRPNVTADAAALCLRAGNVVILRGGSEAKRSNTAIHAALVEGLEAAGLPAAAVQFVPSQDRALVGRLLGGLDGTIDLVIPRGSKTLVARVNAEARVPVFSHEDGVNHVYVHAAADLEKAVAITLNSKMRRTSVCGAAETLLIDQAVAASHLPKIAAALLESGCELRGDARAREIVPEMAPAADDDWTTEYLDAVLAVRVVDGLDDAVEHIARYGSSHTDAIVTEDAQAAEVFFARVDSAIVLQNASTQYADGGEFGMGAEIGIATGRLHARGPVGAEQLTTFKYVVRGAGQVRP